MKRIIEKAGTLATIILLSGTFASAQEEPVSKMKNYLEVSYGPQTNLNLQALSAINSDQDQFEFNHFNNLGTFGLRYDHLLNPGFSLGIDFYYLQRRSTGTMTDSSGIQNDAEYIINRFKTQIRLAYHFPISNPNLDVYLGGGIGINNQTRRLLINGELTSSREYPYNFYFPISLRTYAGLRYSFSKHFGANAELGIGGPILNVGFHYRF
ncbi:MAG: hypothetical protein K0S23_1469 [Fluviicola sp.]|jgi:hypothetical protein|uniref:outer membrane beta-barrel protein n=1 Tax=Fluviicola sp. TaxID=1917219 RepID=UPI00262FFBDB|nr:outer membrane beta-barrel protein [Fluviicola sp.]MDF3027162.1 hypothetical protein [Fluviicola sp.]